MGPLRVLVRRAPGLLQRVIPLTSGRQQLQSGRDVRRFLSANMQKKSVCIVGSGNWGSVIAKIVGNNAKNSSTFEEEVRMWVYEEMVEGRKLTEIVNTEHENIKYLPGVKLPTNVVAVPDLTAACTDADVLVFVTPHQFVEKACQTILPHLKKDAVAVSLIKGFAFTPEGCKLVSDIIKARLGLAECAVLMGANVAKEVALEQFCEATIGCRDKANHQLLRELFSTSYFRCAVVEDARTVESCGALKNVVAIAAGVIDGLEQGANTKAAVIRLGFKEITKFCQEFMKDSKFNHLTFFESCGLADIIATSQGGRNRLLGEALAKSHKSVEELEKEMMHGQSFQGPPVAKELYQLLERSNAHDRYPIFVLVHLMCTRQLHPSDFLQRLTQCLPRSQY